MDSYALAGVAAPSHCHSIYMCIDMYTEMRTGMYIDVHIDVYIDITIDICMNMGLYARIDMCIDIQMGVWTHRVQT